MSPVVMAVLVVCGLVEISRARLRLTVLHTNDVHARFEEVSRHGGPCRRSDVIAGNCFGGVARRMTAIRHIRNVTDHVLMLDAGDQFQGTLWFFVHKGGATGHFMNRLGYDAMALGNHELDNGVSGLLPFLDQVNFPVLCSNLNTSQEPEVGKRLKSSVVFKVEGQKVGVIGYITRETIELSDAGNLIFLDEVQSVRQQVGEMRSSGVNIVIALGHAGYDLDLKLAREVDGLDLIIGGHTDTFLYTGEPPSIEKPIDDYPKLVRQDSGRTVLVVHNYAFGKYLGRLDLTFDDTGEVMYWHGNPILLDNSIEQAPDILREMETWRKPVLAINNEVVGSTKVFLDGEKASCRLRECTMGNLVTSAMLYSYTKDIPHHMAANAAIVNSGAIRASLEQGSITLADLQTVQPFQNTFDVVEIRGKHIRTILEHSVAGYDVTRKHGRFLQLAGLRVLYDLSRPDGKKVKDVCIQSEAASGRFEPLMADKVYRLVVTTFLIKGGDGYTMIKKNALKIDISESLDIEVTMKYLQSHSPVVMYNEGRIVFVDDTEGWQWRCEPVMLRVIARDNAISLDKSRCLGNIVTLVLLFVLYS